MSGKLVFTILFGVPFCLVYTFLVGSLIRDLWAKRKAGEQP